GETGALSQLSAETLGVRVGSTIDLRLGDGTKTRPTVVAIYGRGLGFGEGTLPHHLLAAHTTLRADQAVLGRVVRTSGRGLGFCGVPLPHHLLAAPTTLRSDQAVRVRADAAANRAMLASA